MARISKETNPELYCAYEHCPKRLSAKHLMWNAKQDYFGNAGMLAHYCCRRHKELANQQRRNARRRALREAGAQA